MRIVFMGTPEIADVSLKKLLDTDNEIVGVFTQPDKPVGRRQVLTPPPVKLTAQGKGIPVFQPETLRDGEAIRIISDLNPDIIVVVAYGKILPKEILEFPKYGCINGHASILPKYRGASPIQWCIVCGEKQTGVTAMYMDEGMDTGDIISTVKTDIGADETAGELYERLALMAAELMCKTVEDIKNAEVVRTPQNSSEATYAPIIKKEMALIDFSRSAYDIHNMVRGYNPWPIAYFMLDGKRVKVYSSAVKEGYAEAPGTVVESENTIIIACGDDTAIELCEIQYEGSKRMRSGEFLRGRKMEKGISL